MAGHRGVEVLFVEDDANDVPPELHAMKKYALSNRVHGVRDGVEALDFMFCTGPYADGAWADMALVMLSSSGKERDIIESYRLRGCWLLLNEPPVEAAARR